MKMKDMKNRIIVGLPIGCGKCVLPKGYAGAIFHSVNGETICNFCIERQERKFLGGKQLISDLNLDTDEQVGVTVSGRKKF